MMKEDVCGVEIDGGDDGPSKREEREGVVDDADKGRGNSDGE